MIRNEGERLSRVIVSTPREQYFKVSDPKLHNFNEIADPERTHAQHGELCAILSRSGAEVIDLPELIGHPNSVFTRDASVVTPQGYVKLRLGLSSRRGEADWMASALEQHGEPCAGEIERPGTVEGGDVILAGKVAFVGHSSRTNSDGVRQMSELLQKMGFEVRIADVDNVLHLGGTMSVIAPERILACRGNYPGGFFKGFEVVWVEEEGPSTGNVICLGPNEVLANEAENLRTMEALDAAGVAVQGVDLSEFRKGAGGPTCLILPVERKA
ncbi:MAG TPA: arginine deiminase family protein [Vicinamibacteria bacterium]|nr:arginine deiminase family protein [Vicinamibacteria bacterium]